MLGRHSGRRAVTSAPPFASPVLPEHVTGHAPILLVCDHASSAVPFDIALGIDPSLLDRHVAVDIGAAPLTRALAKRLGAAALLATVSRLVIDLNRPADHPGLIPTQSDGHDIPGNVGADRLDRIARFHAPYHRRVAEEVRKRQPRLIVAVHSFTPELETAPAPRPWPIGILSNRDRRAADLAIGLLRDRGLNVGDNQPYSGRQLNMTLNRHGEGNGIAGLAIEVRNDQLSDETGVEHWADLLAGVIVTISARLASRTAETV